MPFTCCFASCGGSETPAEDLAPDYELREVARYGWSEIADSARPLTAAERTHEGGVLANPVDVAEDTAGNVYVMDGGFFKVAVFTPDGSFDRLIAGGAGEGPGEFRMPRNISVGRDGDVWVYDRIAHRLTHFAPDGTVSAVIPAPVRQMVDMVAAGGLIYGTMIGTVGRQGLAVFDTSGNVLHEGMPLDEIDFVLSGEPTGHALGITPDDNAVLVLHSDAGHWTRVSGVRESETRGMRLFPDATSDRTGADADEDGGEINVWGGGTLSDGRTVIFHAMHDVPDSDGVVHRLAIFNEDNEYEGSLDVPADRGTFGVSLRTPDIFVVESSPYPQVVRYRITAR